ncbi:MAG: hypothetical protein RMI01_09125, partial [Thermodesulfovibrio sp.]|nr:hypothetical protein [Thermodesulfovibrio sp.]
DNPLQIYYSSKSYYDLVNRKQVIIYGLFFSEKMVLELIGGNSEEFNETFLKMLKEAEENGQLKENHEKVYSELSEKFEFLKSKQMVAVN